MKAPFTLFFTMIPSLALAQGFDITSQNIRVDLTGAEVQIDLQVMLEATQNMSIIDLFTPALPITSLTVDGTTLTAIPHPQERTLARRINLPAQISSGSMIDLRLSQRGTFDCRSITTQGAISCVHRAARTVLIPSQPGMAWHFVNLYASDPYTGTIEVRAPIDHNVVAGQGDPLETIDNGDGTGTWRFRYDVPAEGLALSSGRIEVINSTAGFPVSGWFEDTGTQRAHMEQAVPLVSSLIPIYSEVFGETQLERAHLISVPVGFEFGGLGLLGTVLAGEYVFGELDYLLVQGMAHEFAHTWWGNLANAEDPDQAAFFNESFAEYSAWMALGRLQGEAVRTAGVRMNAVWYMYRRPRNVDVAIFDPNGRQSPAFIFAVYHKGSVALRALATLVGEDLFLRALRRLVALGPGGVSTAALADAVVQEGGPNLGNDLVTWLRETGFPHLSVESTIEGNEARLVITQNESFNLRVPIVVRLADGTAVASTIDVGGGQSEHRIAGVDGAIAIEIDPTWTSPREINPAKTGDVTFDGVVNAYDLIEVGLRQGTELAAQRRVDGGYDPLFDPNVDRRVTVEDLDLITAQE